MGSQIRTLSDLKPDPRNANRGTERGRALLEQSLRQYGAGRSILADKNGVVIAGNKTLEQAVELGLEVEVVKTDGKRLVVVQREDLDLAKDKTAKALAISDNRVGQIDLDFAPGVLAELSREIDLGQFWNPDEMKELLADFDGGSGMGAVEDVEPQIDKAEELREKWGVETGQMWQLGEHRLLCGDSTKREDVERVMGGESASICFTSPPYAQQRDYNSGEINWDELMRGVFGQLHLTGEADYQVLVNLGLVHKDGEWWPYWNGWIDWMMQEGWRRFGWYVWDQGFGLPGDWNGRFAPSHEFIFHFNKNPQRPNKIIDKKPENIKARSQGASTMRRKDGITQAFSSPEASSQPNKIPDSVIRINRMHGGHNIAHPAIFPVEFPSLFLASWPGLAYEPFSGSGTTLIACENLNRKCRAIEISPGYVAVALERWSDLTGKQPKLL